MFLFWRVGFQRDGMENKHKGMKGPLLVLVSYIHYSNNITELLNSILKALCWTQPVALCHLARFHEESCPIFIPAGYFTLPGPSFWATLATVLLFIMFNSLVSPYLTEGSNDYLWLTAILTLTFNSSFLLWLLEACSLILCLRIIRSLSERKRWQTKKLWVS